MNQLMKLSYEQISDQQMIDLRSQKEFQRGHLQDALNLTPKNLLKYGKHFLSK
ncbi:MAG TPA: rhodanese-like domain-containing protein, partial [Candidatus Jeotgalibaca pullicola]|nr:rhodanese-like domain-containing protein [Candidatus Jeotgalibaca pullicola]